MRPTLVFQGHTIGPDEFEALWQRSAAALAAAGVGDGDVVALMMRNSPEAIELMVAARHLGAQWCPVNWHFKTDEVQYILGNSGAKVFIADAALLDGLHGLDMGGARVWTTRGTLPGVPAWEPLRDSTPPLSGPGRRRRAARCSTPPAPPAGPRASCARR